MLKLDRLGGGLARINLHLGCRVSYSLMYFVPMHVIEGHTAYVCASKISIWWTSFVVGCVLVVSYVSERRPVG